MNPKKLTGLGKFLSLILRHHPERIGLELDENGWADVATLITQMSKHKKSISLEELAYIVENNSKKRYAFNEDKTKIRANQGHSIKVDLGLEPLVPPAKLYHGTAERFLDSILEKGLIKKGRHHVHLSLDIETATQVGSRHGKVAILEVDASQMHTDGIVFYKSENDVWLTDHVDSKYLNSVDLG